MSAALLADELLDERPGTPLGRCPGCSRPMVGQGRCGECFARLCLRGLHPGSASYRVMERVRRRMRYSEILAACPDLDKAEFDRVLFHLHATGRLRRPEPGHYEPRSLAS